MLTLRLTLPICWQIWLGMVEGLPIFCLVCWLGMVFGLMTVFLDFLLPDEPVRSTVVSGSVLWGCVMGL